MMNQGYLKNLVLRAKHAFLRFDFGLIVLLHSDKSRGGGKCFPNFAT